MTLRAGKKPPLPSFMNWLLDLGHFNIVKRQLIADNKKYYMFNKYPTVLCPFRITIEIQYWMQIVFTLFIHVVLK